MSFGTVAKRLLIRYAGRRASTWIQAVRFRQLLMRGPRESELALLPLLLQPGDVAVDVGANGADWTYPMARRVGDAGCVFAFEADPYYAEATAKTVRLLGLRNVRFYPHGLSDRDQQGNLLVVDETAQRVSGRGRLVGMPEPEHVGRTVPVELRRLDAIAAEDSRLTQVKFIKCDVEGFELMVLRGADQTLARARPVVLAEIGHAPVHGVPDHAVHDFLGSRDYRSYVLDATTGRLVADESAGRVVPQPYNCLFIPAERQRDFLAWGAPTEHGRK